MQLHTHLHAGGACTPAAARWAPPPRRVSAAADRGAIPLPRKRRRPCAAVAFSSSFVLTASSRNEPAREFFAWRRRPRLHQRRRAGHARSACAVRCQSRRSRHPRCRRHATENAACEATLKCARSACAWCCAAAAAATPRAGLRGVEDVPSPPPPGGGMRPALLSSRRPVGSVTLQKACSVAAHHTGPCARPGRTSRGPFPGQLRAAPSLSPCQLRAVACGSSSAGRTTSNTRPAGPSASDALPARPASPAAAPDGPAAAHGDAGRRSVVAGGSHARPLLGVGLAVGAARRRRMCMCCWPTPGAVGARPPTTTSMLRPTVLLPAVRAAQFSLQTAAVQRDDLSATIPRPRAAPATATPCVWRRTSGWRRCS